MRRAQLRQKVLQRDRGVCVDCKVDCLDLERRLERLKGDRGCYEMAWAELELHGYDRHRPLWEADHDLAIDEGGADELDNVVTRCVPCHRKKTTEQANRKARIRKLVGRKHLGETPKPKPARKK